MRKIDKNGKVGREGFDFPPYQCAILALVGFTILPFVPIFGPPGFIIFTIFAPLPVLPFTILPIYRIRRAIRPLGFPHRSEKIPLYRQDGRST